MAPIALNSASAQRCVPGRHSSSSVCAPAAVAAHTHALAPRPRRAAVATRAGLEDAINAATKFLQNSPINQGKKALALAQAGDYDAAAVRGRLDDYIRTNKVVVFSWTGCPFCKKAKALLSELKADYLAVELDTMGEEGKALRAELAKMTDRTSVPNIFIAGENVGGCNDGPGVMTLHGQGKLVPKLQAAGAL